jgi:hypothetical protein
MAEFTYNYTPYSSTKMSPFKVIYGYELLLPQLADIKNDTSVIVVEEHLKTLKELYKQLEMHLVNA